MKKIKEFIEESLITLAIISFSFGFAIFVTSIIRLIEPTNPWIMLIIGLGLMIAPVVFGVWEIRHVRKRLFRNLKRLKID